MQRGRIDETVILTEADPLAARYFASKLDAFAGVGPSIRAGTSHVIS
jgi:hypothetical protein